VTATAAPAPAALRLGYAGLLPFVGGAALVWLLPVSPAQVFVAQALSAYAALIISFLGGIHWGHVMRGATGLPPLAWGVLPSLLAWPALLMPAHAALVVHGVLLLACYAVDRRLYAAAGTAAWLTLRFRLSAVAALSCFIGAAGT
jgi:hypothetical protein